MRAWRRLRNLWRGGELAREFDDEIAFHLEQRVEANLRKGMTPAEAGTEARRHFGSPLRTREGMREARVAEGIAAFGRDLRVASRMARRQPGLAALAVVTVSLGIGATGAVFALIEATLIRPLPYPEPSRLVAVVDTFRIGPPRTGPTIPELLDLREAATSFEHLSFVDWRDFQIGGGTEPARVLGARAEVSLLRALGVTPALGRLFADGEGSEGSPPVVILTDRFWRANFVADPAVIGKRIALNTLPTEVIGVLPPGFEFDFFAAEPVDVYLPFPMFPAYTSRSADFAGVRRVAGIGLLRAGTGFEQANTEVRTIGERIAAAHPELYRQGTDRRDTGFAIRLEGLQEFLFGGNRFTARLMLIAALVLLATASVNMAQFLLAHAVERRAEIAVRSALGAARSRLARQLAAESVVLAAVAGGAGLLVAGGFIQLLRLQTQDRFIAGRLELNVPVVAFTVGMAAVVSLLCNIVPVLRLARSSPLQLLATREAAPPTRSKHALLAVQVAITVALVGVSALLVHSLTRTSVGDRGYTPEGVTSIRLRSRAQGSNAAAQYRQYLERLRAVPDVSAVAMADTPVPLFAGSTFAVEGGAADAATLSAQQSAYVIVSPDYFATMEVPLRAGRTFTDHDQIGRPLVAIVNEELARRAWPGQQAIGRLVRSGEGPRAAWMTVVGVVGNVRPAMQLEPIPQVYVSYLQQPEPNMGLLLRSRAGRPLPLAAIKAAVWSVAPDQALFGIRPLPDMLAGMTDEPRRSLAILLGSAASMAVIISGAGMFTLITYVTARRRREIALRRVIGAGIRDVLRIVSVPTLRWTCVGLAVGLVATIGAAGILRANFAGVAPNEPRLLVSVALFYLVVGGAAMCAPVLGALRDDPATILRCE